MGKTKRRTPSSSKEFELRSGIGGDIYGLRDKRRRLQVADWSVWAQPRPSPCQSCGFCGCPPEPTLLPSNPRPLPPSLPPSPFSSLAPSPPPSPPPSPASVVDQNRSKRFLPDETDVGTLAPALENAIINASDGEGASKLNFTRLNENIGALSEVGFPVEAEGMQGGAGAARERGGRGGGEEEGKGVCAHIMHVRSRRTITPRTPTMPGELTRLEHDIENAMREKGRINFLFRPLALRVKYQISDSPRRSLVVGCLLLQDLRGAGAGAEFVGGAVGEMFV